MARSGDLELDPGYGTAKWSPIETRGTGRISARRASVECDPVASSKSPIATIPHRNRTVGSSEKSNHKKSEIEDKEDNREFL